MGNVVFVLHDLFPCLFKAIFSFSGFLRIDGYSPVSFSHCGLQVDFMRDGYEKTWCESLMLGLRPLEALFCRDF